MHCVRQVDRSGLQQTSYCAKVQRLRTRVHPYTSCVTRRRRRWRRRRLPRILYYTPRALTYTPTLSKR